MTRFAASSDPQEIVLARSLIYRRLADGFRYPDEVIYPLLASPSLYEELRGACAVLEYHECAHDLSELGPASVLPRTEMESAYLDSFEVTDGTGNFCSLHEGNYRRDLSHSQLLIELKSLYEHFGLVMAEEANELPDHVCAELEFMHFLTLKQAEALEAGADADAYIQAQRDVGTGHLKCWLPAQAVRASEVVTEAFYRQWSQLTADFISREPF